MRTALLMLSLLAACSDEPSFDEQFDKQSADIEAEATKIERDLKSQIDVLPEATETEKPDMPVKDSSK